MTNLTLQRRQLKGLKPEEILDEISLMFQSIFGIKFTKMIDSKEKELVWMTSWTEGLRGLTTPQIYEALSLTTKTLKWPPTPAEFRELVEEKIDYEQLYNETSIALSIGNFTPLMWHAAAKFGRYELRNGAKTPEAIRRFRDIVDSLRGLPLTLPEHLSAKQLPSPGQTYNAEIAIDFLSRAKEILKGYDK